MPALILFFFGLISGGYLPSKSRSGEQRKIKIRVAPPDFVVGSSRQRGGVKSPWRVQIKAARSPSAVFWCPGNPQPARRMPGTKTWAKWASEDPAPYAGSYRRTIQRTVRHSTDVRPTDGPTYARRTVRRTPDVRPTCVPTSH